MLAAVLGAFVARTALAPIASFTRSTETLSGRVDLSRADRGQGRRDELGAARRGFNGTLDALERAVDAQRQLVADASHELRTPIASLRANIQVLADADRLPPGEQVALRRDIVDELDELTALVADVVELARGAEPESAGEDVRLDELVSAPRECAAAEARYFEPDLAPTVVSGPPRPDRAARSPTSSTTRASGARRAATSRSRSGTASSPSATTAPASATGGRAARLRPLLPRDEARSIPGSGLGLAIVRQAAEAGGGWVRAATPTAAGPS